MAKRLGPTFTLLWIIAAIAFFCLTWIGLRRLSEPEMETSNLPPPPTQGAPQNSNPNNMTASAPIGTVNQTNISGPVTIAAPSPPPPPPVTHELLAKSPFDSLQITKETLDIQFGEQEDAEVEVWVLWRDGSWKSDEVKINSPHKVEEFFRSSRLQQSLKTEQVIGCVGLASNKMNTRLRSSGEDERDKVLGNLADRRAFELCRMLADATKDLPKGPRFVGIGAGYNTEQPATNADELKQRALVFLAVRSTSGKPLEKSDVNEIIAQIFTGSSMVDFQPAQYSRVSQGRPLCWVSIEQGVISPRGSDCV